MSWKKFYAKIGAVDAVIISFAEHNGTYTAAYKNLFDWVSRIDTKVYRNKPALLLASSPGKGGAGNVLAQALNSAGHFGMDVRGSMSIPNFHANFDGVRGKVINPDLNQKLNQAVRMLTA